MNTPILASLADRIGEEVGLSDWFKIEQARIDEFSRATDDPDPMHVDPAWCAANSPFHSTIAFGFLTLSMLTSLSRRALGWAHDSTVETGGYAINYGLDRVRFVAPVPVNSRIRARFVVAESKEVRPGEQLTKFNVTIEIEGQERPALVAEWLGLWVSGEGHTRIEAKQGVRITDYVGRWARATPDREAAVLGDIRLAYAELEHRVDRLARALLAAGVRRGDRVATLCTPHPDFYVTFLAASSIGALWLGLNPKYTLDELRYVVDDADPSVLFARTRIGDRDYRGDLTELCRGSRRALVALGDDALPARAEPFVSFEAHAESVTAEDLARARALVEAGDAAMLVYTSGTTGRPKGAMLPHRGLVTCSEIQSRVWTADPLRILNNFPINHVGCVGDICCYVLVSGGTIVFMEQFEPKAILKTIAQERITAYGQIPAMFALTLETGETADLSSVQIIIWSGAAAPRDLIVALREICPRMSSSYGLTESVGSVTYVRDTEDLEILADTIGWPHPAYEFRLASPEGAAVPVGEPGEIQVRGDFIMLGYWSRPEATREAIDEQGWLHTGDLAVERPDGAIKLIGRLKEMFKSGGYNVYPREIEIALESHPAVRLAAVIGVPDPLYVEVGHAFVAAEGITDEDLREHCRSRLANYKVPKRFTISADLPLLPIGKIDKRALRALVTPT